MQLKKDHLLRNDHFEMASSQIYCKTLESARKFQPSKVSFLKSLNNR